MEKKVKQGGWNHSSNCTCGFCRRARREILPKKGKDSPIYGDKNPMKRPEMRRLFSILMSGERNPNYGKFGKLNVMARPEVREKHRRAVTTKEYREKKAKEMTPERRAAQRRLMLERNPMKNPESVKKMRETQIRKGLGFQPGEANPAKRPEVRIKMSLNHADISGDKNPMKRIEVKERNIRARMRTLKIKPNKAEQRLNSILQSLLPGEYKYVGDGEFILGGKCPDFININGKKKIIELFGEFWHEKDKKDNGQNRVDFFKKYGYDTLIIWEGELQNEPALKNKIIEFHNGD